MTIQEFEEMVRRHDLTYAYSDDYGVWRSGQNSLDNIKKAAENFPHEEVARIWNKYVDLKLVPGARKNCYW